MISREVDKLLDTHGRDGGGLLIAADWLEEQGEGKLAARLRKRSHRRMPTCSHRWRYYGYGYGDGYGDGYGRGRGG